MDQVDVVAPDQGPRWPTKHLVHASVGPRNPAIQPDQKDRHARGIENLLKQRFPLVQGQQQGIEPANQLTDFVIANNSQRLNLLRAAGLIFQRLRCQQQRRHLPPQENPDQRTGKQRQQQRCQYHAPLNLTHRRKRLVRRQHGSDIPTRNGNTLG